MNQNMGKLFILLGLAFIIIGVVFYLLPHIPWLGKLPGDLFFKRGEMNVYFPITTSIIISVILTIIINIICKK